MTGARWRPLEATRGRPRPPWRGLALTLLASALGCGEGSDNPVRRALAEQPPSSTQPAVAFRFPPRGRERTTLFRLPGLDEVAWRFEAGTSPISRVVGFASDEDLVYTISARGELVALDLTSGRARTVDTLVAFATIGPTGTPFVVRSDGSVARIQRRSVVPLPDTLRIMPQAIWGGVRDRLIALVHAPEGRQLVTLRAGQEPLRRPLPDGPVAMSAWGDLAAVATDSGVVTVNPIREEPPRFVSLGAPVRRVVLSPSAHRIYVVAGADQLLSVDRPSLTVLDRLTLPGPTAALRADPLGRYLLLRPERGDSLWIVDVTSWALVATLPGAWSENLPQVAPDGTVLIRQNQRVVAFDVATLRIVGATQDAQANHWLVASWDPRRPVLELASDSVAAPAPPGQLIYVQVSSTSNEAWAADLALNLRRAGMSATVLPPDGFEEPYRVVLGPYPSRDEAEQIRSRLQMPSWILVRDTTRTPMP